MDTATESEFSVDAAWPSRPCEVVRDYFEEAYGKLDSGRSHAFRGVGKRFAGIRSSFDRRAIPRDQAITVETRILVKRFLLPAWTYLTPQERKRCLVAETRWGNKRNTGTLVVARHRGVPTRCIDWSYDPLVALFFACETDPGCDGEVWWFDREEFDDCVGCQWRALFGKPGHVEPEIERDFIGGHDSTWFTALNYELMDDDRVDRQKAWITIAGRLGSCHAKEIHRLGVRNKGRLVVPTKLKQEAIHILEQAGITRESLGISHDDRVDKIVEQLTPDLVQESTP